jgi:hypothetical protein
MKFHNIDTFSTKNALCNLGHTVIMNYTFTLFTQY